MNAWLIEIDQNPARYLCHCPSDMYGQFAWGPNPNLAMRFAREKDAREFVSAMRAMFAELPLKKCLEGFDRRDSAIRVCEHHWGAE